MSEMSCSLGPGPAAIFDDPVAEWNKKFESSVLSDGDFRRYWAVQVYQVYKQVNEQVPTVYIAGEEVTNAFKPVTMKITNEHCLIRPLEEFIFGSREPSRVIEQIKSVNESPTLCGKVFKHGEPTYLCKECARDPTCVLCVECFTQSEHKNHHYKMGTSSGGGYCDCGDTEAWKTACHCNKHCAKSEQLESMTPIDNLPQDLVERYRIVLSVVLKYCHEILTWENALNLSDDLQNPNSTESEISSTYCTVLYNDETHTYEQVIDTLQKAVNCSKRQAIEYATSIDREGRSTVKMATFSVCNQVRQYIEKVTSRLSSKLKVCVMHSEIVSHQCFALKLLSWLHEIVNIDKGFAYLFSEVIREDRLLEDIMVADTNLWKAARHHWHQLFIVGMLMDANSKKEFARSFIGMYPTMMKEFISDDHDHSISITSLSVQIFTVPTVAHMLIEEKDAISVILRTFLSECQKRHVNEEGKLHFQRNLNNGSFRRSQYMLFDLYYLVTIVPTVWNDSLRRNFCKGMQSLFTLLGIMQDMDKIVRQTGQHVEYEAEWESGINLQMKLVPVISSMLRWCASDFTVYKKSLKANFISTKPIFRDMNYTGVEIADHAATCVEYDVSSQLVSVYQPLIRFLSGLLLQLRKFNMMFEDSYFEVEDMFKPTPEQMMEPTLRTLVMVSQYRAGLWRRNGFALLNQVYFYHNVRMRIEMLDRDIVMMQIAASLIEANEFLIHIVYKYGLLDWATNKDVWNSDAAVSSSKKPEDDNVRQNITMAEEFLSLILTIISERFTPNLGDVDETDCMRKEIIQLLAMEPMTHSQLYKLLPNDEDGPLEMRKESILNEVALFRVSQTSGIGKYELKPEYYKCYNPFYYHYSREDQSKAEEAQVKRKKQNCEEVCCPPPDPPKFIPRYQILSNIAQCDVMLHIMELVLKRTLDLHAVAFSETQVEKVLHITGVALHDEKSYMDADAENCFYRFTERAAKKNILPLLEECLKSPRVEICGETLKDLISWVIAKYKYIEGLSTQCEKMEDTTGEEASTSSKSIVNDRKRKTEIAAARRTRIMAQMSAMQKSFIKEHAEMFKETLLQDPLLKSEMDFLEEGGNDQPVCFRRDPSFRIPTNNVYTCILCREDQELSCTGRVLVLSVFAQKSTILSKNRKNKLDNVKSFNPVPLPADLFWSVHVSTCGHVMHDDCWDKFFQSVLAKEQRRTVIFSRVINYDVYKKEFLCPLCERLSNRVIPLLPPLSSLIPSEIYTKKIDTTLDDFLDQMKDACSKPLEKIERSPEKDVYTASPYKPLILEDFSESFQKLFSLFESEVDRGQNFSSNMIDMLKYFSEAPYTVGLNPTVDITDQRLPSMAWISCIYSIHAMERVLRSKNMPIFAEGTARNSLSMDALIRFCGASLSVFESDSIRTESVDLLRYLLIGNHYTSHPKCCLDVDAFSILAYLVLSMPVLFKPKTSASILHPLGMNLDKYLLHLVLVFHIVQVLLTSSFETEETMETDAQALDDSVDSEKITTLVFYEEIVTATGFQRTTPAPSGHTLVHCVKIGVLPFLRCAALFFQKLTDTPPPTTLQEISDREFSDICLFLGLPHRVDELLAPASLKHLALNWARHPHNHLLMNLRSTEQVVTHPVSVNRLIDLPTDYSDLINSVSQFTCPKSEKDEGRVPTMCLVCGEVLCSASYCCQLDLNHEGQSHLVGACTFHTFTCGSGSGIFLRIRDCKVLLLHDRTKGCFTSPPYVDKYGETDQGLHRGDPLYLCPKKYTELNELWLSHNIPEKVSHSLDLLTSAPNWQLF